MGLGETIGYSTRLTMNNSGLYQNQANNMARGVHIALMGDPTLRMHQVAPVPSLNATPTGGSVALTWGASPDAVAGYHVYRAASVDGPFTRLTTSLITATNFSDTAPPSTNTVYMVRAVKLEKHAQRLILQSEPGNFCQPICHHDDPGPAGQHQQRSRWHARQLDQPGRNQLPCPLQRRIRQYQ